MNYKDGSAKHIEGFWRAVAVIFILLSIFLAWLAVRGSQALKCNDVIKYEDGSMVCEVVIQEADV